MLRVGNCLGTSTPTMECVCPRLSQASMGPMPLQTFLMSPFRFWVAAVAPLLPGPAGADLPRPDPALDVLVQQHPLDSHPTRWQPAQTTSLPKVALLGPPLRVKAILVLGRLRKRQRTGLVERGLGAIPPSRVMGAP